MKNKPKYVWMAGANLSGPWNNKPIRGKYRKELNQWYDKSGDISASTLGLNVQDGYVHFTSTRKREVECFIAGMGAILTMVRQYCRFVYPMGEKK